MAASEYQDYLAARVLSESKPVTYRLLARALNVNVNVAKRMLFDFHHNQNAKKPKSVHATYIVSGTKRAVKHDKAGLGRDGDDTVMQSSPFMSSMPEQADEEEEPVKKTAIVVAREEELDATRAQFETELSIHIYSLEPGPIENLSVLSVCNQEINSHQRDEDPLERWRTYGSIQNPYIKRRTTKYAPPAATTKTLPVTSKPVAKPASVAQPKREDSLPSRKGSASESSTPSQSTSQPAGATSTLKRSDSKPGAKKDKTAGDIFKSFAKAKAKPKEDKSKESTPAPVEDEPMQGMSEDEGDADDAPEVAFNDEAAEAAKKARQERADKLRKMMEEPDEEMTEAPPAEEMEVEVSQPEKADAPKPEEEQPTVTVSNGRRRGKRRVMVKKKVKDEEGYLVTKEEAVWESFSEDEPEPKKLKPAPAKPAATTKGKAAGKKGQGSIASFFKKA